MSKKDRMEDIAQSLKANPLVLPKDVTMHSTITPEGHVAYVFRHQYLGELGKMVIVPHSQEKTQWDSQIAGDPDDPMTQQRREIIEPFFQELYQRADTPFGASSPQSPPYKVPQEEHLIKSMVMPCVKCGAITAMLIFADGDEASQLEDYARLMFAKVKELNVPTWVVGREKIIRIGSQTFDEALVLKIWPTREAARIIPPTELNPLLDELMETHCS